MIMTPLFAPHAILTVTVSCSIASSTASTLDIECIASAEVDDVKTCSYDGEPAVPCMT